MRKNAWAWPRRVPPWKPCSDEASKLPDAPIAVAVVDDCAGSSTSPAWTAVPRWWLNWRSTRPTPPRSHCWTRCPLPNGTRAGAGSWDLRRRQVHLPPRGPGDPHRRRRRGAIDPPRRIGVSGRMPDEDEHLARIGLEAMKQHEHQTHDRSTSFLALLSSSAWLWPVVSRSQPRSHHPMRRPRLQPQPWLRHGANRSSFRDGAPTGQQRLAHLNPGRTRHGLAEAGNHAGRDQGQEIDVHSLLVIRNGYLVSETYFDSYQPDAKQDMQSVGRSFTSALIGIVIDKGYIDGIDHRIVDFFPNANVCKSRSAKGGHDAG